MTIENELKAAALALPRERRAELARVLLESLDEHTEVDDAWRTVVRERLAAYRDGTLRTVPAEEVLAKARSRPKA